VNSEELKIELEKAATSMLTDDEICGSLEITKEELLKNYTVVSKARIKLKQRLNAKRITDAAASGDTTEILAQIPRNAIQYKGEGHGPYLNKSSTRGGARMNSGPKTDNPNKMTGRSLLRAIEERTGSTFEALLAQGYQESIENRDNNTRMNYERMFLGKVVSDKVELDISNYSLKETKTEDLLDDDLTSD
jgi:hypothetical protein